jgi:hypothetical protein
MEVMKELQIPFCEKGYYPCPKNINKILFPRSSIMIFADICMNYLRYRKEMPKSIYAWKNKCNKKSKDMKL